MSASFNANKDTSRSEEVVSVTTSQTAVPIHSPTPWVEVAVGILLRHFPDQTEVLLAQRSGHQHYSGYWEFPGGKVESGEHIEAALQRELQEELAIQVTEAYAWGGPHHFIYPHARVRLFFYRVFNWEDRSTLHAGLKHVQEGVGAEGQALQWFPLHSLPSVSILPANLPLLRLLSAPTTLLITDIERYGFSSTLNTLHQWLDQPAPFSLMFRDKTLPFEQRVTYGKKLLEVIKQQRQDCPLLWNGTPTEAIQSGFDGVHCPQSVWQSPSFTWPDPSSFPATFWKSAACHTSEHLHQIQAMGFDAATYSPVCPTATHLNTTPMGWNRFAEDISRHPYPIYALGGMGLHDHRTAWQHGAHGIALCSAVWPHNT